MKTMHYTATLKTSSSNKMTLKLHAKTTHFSPKTLYRFSIETVHCLQSSFIFVSKNNS